MKSSKLGRWWPALGVLVAGLVLVGVAVGGPADPLEGWSHDFAADKADLVATGRNPYCVLEPGWGLVLEDGTAKLVVTVRDETKKVDGVDCRVVEELETKDGKVTEDSLNYLAISRRTNSVYCFGENTGGAWLAGEQGARFGLLVPGLPLVAGRYYIEVAPGAAMDRAEVVSATFTYKTPAGEFHNCLKTKETTPLEPGDVEYKVYAPGVGLIYDAGLKLTRYGPGVK